MNYVQMPFAKRILYFIRNTMYVFRIFDIKTKIKWALLSPNLTDRGASYLTGVNIFSTIPVQFPLIKQINQ